MGHYNEKNLLLLYHKNQICRGENENDHWEKLIWAGLGLKCVTILDFLKNRVALFALPGIVVFRALQSDAFVSKRNLAPHSAVAIKRPLER